MAGSRHKKTNAPLPGKREKKARIRPEGSAHEKISWHFRIMEQGGRWGLESIEKEEWRHIVSKMSDYESQTWGELEGDRNHSIPVKDLCPEAQKSIQKRQLDDVDSVFSIHFNGVERLFGIRDRHVFKILWWDRKHEICPCAKKHA